METPIQIEIGSLKFDNVPSKPTERDKRMIERGRAHWPRASALGDLFNKEAWTDAELFVIRCIDAAYLSGVADGQRG